MPTNHRALAATIALVNFLAVSSLCQTRESASDTVVLKPSSLLPRWAVLNEEADLEKPRSKPVKRAPSGLILTRLTNSEKKKWNEMAKLVRSRDEAGKARYPTLSGLLEWAETSIHQIVIEIADKRGTQSSTAGSFSFERFEAGGQHTVLIRLNLQSIDSAIISEKSERRAGFVPFRSLRREERYVEVLGHELAHAKYILSNEMRCHLVRELVEAVNGLVIFHAHAGDEMLKSPEIAARLRQRDQLLKDLEANAYETEEEIWKELLRVQRPNPGGDLITSRTK